MCLLHSQQVDWFRHDQIRSDKYKCVSNFNVNTVDTAKHVFTQWNLERTGQIDWKSGVCWHCQYMHAEIPSRVDVGKDQRVNQVRLANYANELSDKWLEILRESSCRNWYARKASFALNRLYTKLTKQQTVWIHLSNLTCSFCFQCKSLHMLCHCGQSKQSLTKCNVSFFQFPNVLHSHILLWKSIQSSAIDYFKSHPLAQHSTNEDESATDLEWYSILKHYNTLKYYNIYTCPSTK